VSALRLLLVPYYLARLYVLGFRRARLDRLASRRSLEVRRVSETETPTPEPAPEPQPPAEPAPSGDDDDDDELEAG
jgi:hypothetical protein